jgi:hypothetical protein
MKKSHFMAAICLAAGAAVWLAGCAQQPSRETAAPAQPTANRAASLTASASSTPHQTAVSPAATALPSFTVIPLPTENPMPEPTRAALPQDPGVRRLIETARQDLAKRLDVGAEAIIFLQFEPVIWPDGSLGCPQPGMQYTQVQVDGYLIRLRYAGQIYTYHGGGNRGPFLCK